MLEFSDELRRNHPKARFDDVIHFYNDARVFLVPHLRRDDISLVAKIPFKIAIILQVGLRRGLHLAEAVVRELNACAFIPSFVLSRALLETACVFYDAWDRVENAMKSPESEALAALDEHLKVVLLGSRSKRLGIPEIIEATNIVTIIERLDRTFGGAIKVYYDDLSEYGHPNFAGMAGAYSQVDSANEEPRLIDDPWKAWPQDVVTPVNATALSLHLITAGLRLHQESFGTVIRACEEEIYRAGTWPPSVPYPWKS